MNSHELIRELIAAYSLDCLDPGEANQVTTHLAQCPECRLELANYLEVVGMLSLAVPEHSASPRLREQIISAIRPTQAAAPIVSHPKVGRQDQQPTKSLKFIQFVLPAWSVLSLVLILLLGVSSLRLNQQLTSLEQSRQGFQTITLSGSGTAANSVGLLVISPDGQNGSLVVDRMPALSDNQDYQLWLVKDDARISGGVFHSYSNGYGVLWIHATEPLSSFDSFGVTIEPLGGSPDPTGEKIIGSNIN